MKSFIFLLILFLNFFTNPIYCFTPPSTYAHSSSLVNNRIYYFGGMNIITDNPPLSYNKVFYLDVNNNFDISSPPWTDLTNVAAIPFGSSWATTSIGGVDKSLIFLFGGFMDSPTTGDDIFVAMTYQFDTKSPSWSKSSLSGYEPTRRREMQAIHDDNGRIYIFGGHTDNLMNSTITKSFSEMIIIDTISNTYSSDDAPYSRYDYSATMLPSGVIVYIGGGTDFSGIHNFDDEAWISISNISTYDTKAAKWKTELAVGGAGIDDRIQHSASLASDGRIIVYGGKNTNSTPAMPKLIVLDTNANPYRWSTPSESGSPSPPSLILHTSNIIGDYMIIAFGDVLYNSDYAFSSIGSGLYILDTRNYGWTTSFIVPKSNSARKKLSSAQIGGIVGGCVGGLLLSTVFFGLYKVYKRQKENVNQKDYIPTPGGTKRILSSDTNQQLHPNPDSLKKIFFKRILKNKNSALN